MPPLDFSAPNKLSPGEGGLPPCHHATGRVDKAQLSYETKHPVLLPNKHWVSYLISRHMHQFRHCGKAASAAKTKQKFWILCVHDLTKKIKFRYEFYREMELKAEAQVMTDLPGLCLTPSYTPPF